MKQPNRPIPAEYFDEFFTPLVGGPVEVDVLHASLAAAITDPRRDGDMYVRLASGMQGAMHDAIGDRRFADTEARTDWQRIADNTMLGVGFTIQGLRTLGDLYRRHASVAQAPANVARSTRSMLGYIYGYAQTGGINGAINAEALYLGLDPRKLLHVAKIFWHVHRHGISDGDPYTGFNPKSFTVTEDVERQLAFQPRYRRRGKSGVMSCPAVSAKKVPGDRRPRPAMFTLLQTLGDVAIDEIYPQHFDIAQAE